MNISHVINGDPRPKPARGRKAKFVQVLWVRRHYYIKGLFSARQPILGRVESRGGITYDIGRMSEKKDTGRHFVQVLRIHRHYYIKGHSKASQT